METLKNALDFSDFPRLDLTLAAAVAIFLMVFPFFPHSSFAMSTLIQFLMFSLYGMGWNTIGGYGGQVDLGKAQYLGIGAYTTAVMLLRWDTPFWIFRVASAPNGRSPKLISGILDTDPSRV